MENLTTGTGTATTSGATPNEMASEDVIAIIIFFVILAAIIKGGIQTFRRNWIAALLLLIFLFPLWAIWAFFEIFMSKPQPKVHYVNVSNN